MSNDPPFYFKTLAMIVIFRNKNHVFDLYTHHNSSLLLSILLTNTSDSPQKADITFV